MLGLCLIAVLAVAAYAVSSASALPEWGKCEAKVGGKYKDANCTEKAKKGEGAYEWHKGATLSPIWFSGENVGTGGVLTTYFRICEKNGQVIENSRVTRANCAAKGGTEWGQPGTEEAEAQYVECETEESKGKEEGSKSIGNVTVHFKGCSLYGKGIPCQNTAQTGEILVNQLKGSLGYIDKATKEVGVVLEPVKKHGPFAAFDCSGVISVTVGVGNSKEGAYYTPENKGGDDQVISPIIPVNAMSQEFTQVYTVNPETAENIPNKLEGKAVSLLEDFNTPVVYTTRGGMWSPAGEEITNVNYLCTHEKTGSCKGEAEAGEIKA
jgi:hypothetical protein